MKNFQNFEPKNIQNEQKEEYFYKNDKFRYEYALQELGLKKNNGN